MTSRDQSYHEYEIGDIRNGDARHHCIVARSSVVISIGIALVIMGVVGLVLGAVGLFLALKCEKTSLMDGTYQISEKDIDDCPANVCQNGGTCVDCVKEYNCTCTAEYTGINCTLYANPCDRTSPSLCQNNAVCTERAGLSSNGLNYECKCTSNYTGNNCELEITNGGWTEWAVSSESTTYTEDSISCNGVNKAYTRNCTNPEPENGGAACSGDDTKTVFTLSGAIASACTCPSCPDLETNEFRITIGGETCRCNTQVCISPACCSGCSAGFR